MRCPVVGSGEWGRGWVVVLPREGGEEDDGVFCGGVGVVYSRYEKEGNKDSQKKVLYGQQGKGLPKRSLKRNGLLRSAWVLIPTILK